MGERPLLYAAQSRRTPPVHAWTLYAAVNRGSHLAVAVDNLFRHRNALTHEIIQISDTDDDKHVSADASGLSLEEVDSYFDAVGDFIIATMSAFGKLGRRDPKERWFAEAEGGGAEN